MSTATNYTISNTSSQVYNIGPYKINPNSSLSVEHLDSALTAAIDDESDLTVSPSYVESWDIPFSEDYDYTDLGATLTGVTAYPSIASPSTSNLAVAVGALARNLEAVRTSMVALQTAVGLVRDQINDLQAQIKHTNVVPGLN